MLTSIQTKRNETELFENVGTAETGAHDQPEAMTFCSIEDHRAITSSLVPWWLATSVSLQNLSTHIQCLQGIAP
jgi:hypothetical protein